MASENAAVSDGHRHEGRVMAGKQDRDAEVTTKKVDGCIIKEGGASRSAQVVRVSVVGIVTNILLAGFKATFGLLANSIAIVLDAVKDRKSVV